MMFLMIHIDSWLMLEVWWRHYDDHNDNKKQWENDDDDNNDDMMMLVVIARVGALVLVNITKESISN